MTFFSALWRLARAFLAIYACLLAGNQLSRWLPVTIPGSILGMLILFALLTTQLVPLEWVRPGCQLLLRYMALLFVPIGVGVMNYFDLLIAQFGPVVISCLFSTLVTMLLVAGLTEWLERRGEAR